jgi:hypothetical protein
MYCSEDSLVPLAARWWKCLGKNQICKSRHNLFLNPGVWKLLWEGLAGYLLIVIASPEYFRRDIVVH